MADGDNGDPQDYEFLIPLLIGSCFLVCCILACVLYCVGQQCENGSLGGQTDPWCGLEKCCTSCSSAFVGCFASWCTCGSKAVAGAGTAAAGTTKRALSARDKDETNECCGGCDDGGCWNAVTCGVFRTGRTKARRGGQLHPLMPEAVQEGAQEEEEEVEAGKVPVAQPVAPPAADLDAPYYYDNACAPLLALPTGAVIERRMGRV